MTSPQSHTTNKERPRDQVWVFSAKQAALLPRLFQSAYALVCTWYGYARKLIWVVSICLR